MSARLFVLEIGAEEIPSGWVEPAFAQLGEELRGRLAAARLGHGPVRVMGTPRRLIAIIEDVMAKQEDATREERGPPRTACLDSDGQPTKALLGFARSKGVEVDQMEFRATEKGEHAYARVFEAGRPAGEVLATLLPDTILALSFPKTMRWGSRRIRFARPIRWVLALLDTQTVPFAIGDIASGNRSRGHRFLGEATVVVPSAQEYLNTMAAQGILVDPEQRREAIRDEVRRLAEQAGGVPLFHDELVEMNLYLAEHPTGLLGSFPERYLELPEVVLTTVMRKHQKYFPVQGPTGKLLPHFIAIRDGGVEGIDTVRRGNEWVLVGRLDDGRFFYEEDKKRPLSDRVEDLKRVAFIEGLGTLDDKRRRLIALCDRAADWLGLPPGQRESLRKAAHLCKVDLTTHMVIEFTELQGVIGGLYAGECGEDADTAAAIRDHYAPVAAGGPLPTTVPGRVLSLVDKVDHVLGCIHLGLMPSGAGDPQGLRRRTQGAAALVIEGELPIDLMSLYEAACAELKADLSEVQAPFAELLEQRVHAVLERHGIESNVRQAVMSPWRDLFSALPRARLLTDLLAQRPRDFLDATRAATRVGNIVPKRESDRTDVDAALFEHESEAPLYQAILALESALADVPYEAWRARIGLFAEVAPAVDALFSGPLVMAEEPQLRTNRLAMLYRLHLAFTTVADFARLNLPPE